MPTEVAHQVVFKVSFEEQQQTPYWQYIKCQWMVFALHTTDTHEWRVESINSSVVLTCIHASASVYQAALRSPVSASLFPRASSCVPPLLINQMMLEFIASEAGDICKNSGLEFCSSPRRPRFTLHLHGPRYRGAGRTSKSSPLISVFSVWFVDVRGWWGM